MYGLICLCRPSSLGPEVKETLLARLGPPREPHGPYCSSHIHRLSGCGQRPRIDERMERIRRRGSKVRALWHLELTKSGETKKGRLGLRPRRPDGIEFKGELENLVH